MRQNLSIIASNNNFNKTDFLQFCLLPDNMKEFEVETENGFVLAQEHKILALVQKYNLVKLTGFDKTLQDIQDMKKEYENPITYHDDEDYYKACTAKADVLNEVIYILKKNFNK